MFVIHLLSPKRGVYLKRMKSLTRLSKSLSVLPFVPPVSRFHQIKISIINIPQVPWHHAQDKVDRGFGCPRGWEMPREQFCKQTIKVAWRQPSEAIYIQYPASFKCIDDFVCKWNKKLMDWYFLSRGPFDISQSNVNRLLSWNRLRLPLLQIKKN